MEGQISLKILHSTDGGGNAQFFKSYNLICRERERVDGAH